MIFEVQFQIYDRNLVPRSSEYSLVFKKCIFCVQIFYLKIFFKPHGNKILNQNISFQICDLKHNYNVLEIHT